MIAIDKGVPLPDGKRARNRYPISTMEVGDSFFAPNRTPAGLGGLTRRHPPKMFISRTVTVDGQRGVRVWRIA